MLGLIMLATRAMTEAVYCRKQQAMITPNRRKRYPIHRVQGSESHQMRLNGGYIELRGRMSSDLLQSSPSWNIVIFGMPFIEQRLLNLEQFVKNTTLSCDPNRTVRAGLLLLQTSTFSPILPAHAWRADKNIRPQAAAYNFVNQDVKFNSIKAAEASTSIAHRNTVLPGELSNV